MQAKLTPTQKRRKLLLGDVFLGLQNGNFGTELPGWHDHGSISAIDVAHRQARLEVQDAGARARRRHDDRERSRLRRRRRRRAARVRPEDRQGALDVPDRPPDRERARRSTRSTARSTSRSPSGGTPTSSGGGTASELQVFALGASQKQSPPPDLPAFASARASRSGAVVRRPSHARLRARRVETRRSSPAPGGRIVTQAAIAVRPWNANSSNVKTMTGRLLLKGAPVAQRADQRRRLRRCVARRRVGRFRYDADSTLAAQAPDPRRGSRRRDRARPRA